MSPARLTLANRQWPQKTPIATGGGTTPPVDPPVTPPTNGGKLAYAPPSWYLEGVAGTDYVELQAVPGFNSFGSYANQNVVVLPPANGAPFCYQFFSTTAQAAVKSLVQIGGLMEMSTPPSDIQRIIFMSVKGGVGYSGNTVTGDVYLEGIRFQNSNAILGDAVTVLGGITGTITIQNCYIEGIRYTAAIHGDGVQLHGGYGKARFANTYIKSGGQGTIIRPDSGNSGITTYENMLFERFDYSGDDPGAGLSLYIVNDNRASVGGNVVKAAPESVSFSETYIIPMAGDPGLTNQFWHVNFNPPADINGTTVDLDSWDQTFRTYNSTTLAQRFFGEIKDQSLRPSGWSWLKGSVQPGNGYYTPGYEGVRPAGIENISIVHTAASNTVAGSTPPKKNAYGAATNYTTEFEAGYDQNDQLLFPKKPNGDIAVIETNIRSVIGSGVPGSGQLYRPKYGTYYEIGPNEHTETGGLYRRRSETSVDVATDPNLNWVQGETLWVDLFVYPELLSMPQGTPSYCEILQFKHRRGGTPPSAINIKVTNGVSYWFLDGGANPTLDSTDRILGPVVMNQWQRLTIGMYLHATNGRVWGEYNGLRTFTNVVRPTLYLADDTIYMQHGVYETSGDGLEGVRHRIATSGLRVSNTRLLATYRDDLV